MIPVGYMYKRVSTKPEWLKTNQVKDIYSVSGCVSEDFDDWINYWKHNGYWFFDDPSIIESIVSIDSASLDGMQLFFYKVYEKQWDIDEAAWINFKPESSFETNVLEPANPILVGYDVVSYFCQTSAECSPLSCNHLAQEVKVNEHCLLSSFNDAQSLVESGRLNNCEPGPYRIFEVYLVQNA